MKKQHLARQRLMRWRRRKRIHTFDESSVVRRTMAIDVEVRDPERAQGRSLHYTCEESGR